ncbi:hypothetical protein [Aliarcobacter vitoriensis]|uniref:Uncharacterized protein n=1 Tax=Aliarcobacter vitoriensis TaxID=2011099 RepID=A0A366MQ15_9BACT|nr:hypothetical protein [Aliarcobacter vitoriensis]RBQ28356.1 hypothetical protein CRU91_09710 [Aliarcobacter vitoriensis]
MKITKKNIKRIKLNSNNIYGNVSCSITKNIDLNKLVQSMKNYRLKKIILSDVMKTNLDKLGIYYAK